MIEHLQFSPEAREQFDEALFGDEFQQRRRGPDNVSTEVVEEEMALFRAASTTLQSGIGRG